MNFPRDIAAFPTLGAWTKRIADKLYTGRFSMWWPFIRIPKSRALSTGERLFCAQPFERFEVLGGGGNRGDVFFCCQNWVTRSIGNMGDKPVKKVWNGRAAREFRRSILDGNFKYCRAELCPYLQRVDGPVQRMRDVTDPDLLEVIEKRLTVMPFGPKRTSSAVSTSPATFRARVVGLTSSWRLRTRTRF